MYKKVNRGRSKAELIKYWRNWSFNYLEATAILNGGMTSEVNNIANRVHTNYHLQGVMKILKKNRGMGMSVKLTV